MRVPVTGPLPPDLPAELEALKLRLAVMAPDDLPERDATLIGVEISAIRLQLKRLALERGDDRRRPPARPAAGGRAPEERDVS